MTPTPSPDQVYRVRVLLVNGQQWQPLVAARSKDEAKARALRMEVGAARVATVEKVSAIEGGV